MDVNSLPAFLLVMVRVTAFFATVPVFSYRNIPVIHKVGFSFFLSWIMFYTIHVPHLQINTGYLMLVIKETIVGLAIGLVASILFYAIQVAGGFIDLQIGYSMASMFDPQSGMQTPLMGRYLNTFAILLLFVTNAHHLLLDGIFYSYKFLPIGSLHLALGKGDAAELAVKLLSAMFLIAFQMALPIVGTLFLADLALGIVARTVPQLNIFVIGLPVKILIALSLFIIVLPVFFESVQMLVDQITEAMKNILMALGAG